MGVALFDLPMPAWLGASSSESAKISSPAPIAEYSAPATDEILAPVQPEPEALPQGSAAAELAAAAKPRRPLAAEQTHLPAPLVTAGPVSGIASTGGYVAPLLPEPPALDAPLAQAGVIVPEPTPSRQENREDSIWDMLDIKTLPIPGLGSARVAHAAALDMPVPQVNTQNSPFAPAEQLSPVAGQARTLPGAGPVPTNIPGGAGPDGQLLPASAGSQASNGQLMPLPVSPDKPVHGPAPVITPRPSTLDPNVRSQELARQQQDMLMLRQQMDQRLKDLQIQEDRMKDMLKEAKGVEENKVKNLVQMYANMKPRMAAQALENMDERIAVRILGGMAPKQSGEILTYTNPSKTAKLTEMLTRMRLGE